jgi:DNA (cytosine-5)-methyltransferase 1
VSVTPLEGVPVVPSADLFAGAGGLSLGLARAGLTPVVASEMDLDALATYDKAHRQYCGGAPLELLDGDIAKHSFQRFKGEIAVVAGGPPCQPYSSGGKRRGADDDRDGIPDYVRAVEEIAPEAFLMENVPGLAAKAQASRLRELLRAFEDLGFYVDYRLLHVADYGVVQRRQRLVIVGSREPGFEWPKATHGPNGDRPWPTASELLDPHAPIGELNQSIVTFAKQPDLRPSPWDGHLFNGGGRPINPNGLVPTLLASMGGNKTPWLDGGDVVPEYHAHLLAGGTPRMGVVSGARRITTLEAALIQGFPDDMPWHGGSSSRYRQIGNAVPVRMAEVLGRALIEHVTGNKSDVAVDAAA